MEDDLLGSTPSSLHEGADEHQKRIDAYKKMFGTQMEKGQTAKIADYLRQKIADAPKRE